MFVKSIASRPCLSIVPNRLLVCRGVRTLRNDIGFRIKEASEETYPPGMLRASNSVFSTILFCLTLLRYGANVSHTGTNGRQARKYLRKVKGKEKEAIAKKAQGKAKAKKAKGEGAREKPKGKEAPEEAAPKEAAALKEGAAPEEGEGPEVAAPKAAAPEEEVPEEAATKEPASSFLMGRVLGGGGIDARLKPPFLVPPHGSLRGRLPRGLGVLN